MSDKMEDKLKNIEILLKEFSTEKDTIIFDLFLELYLAIRVQQKQIDSMQNRSSDVSSYQEYKNRYFRKD